MAEIKGFIVYLNKKEQLDMLTDEEAGKVFKALFEFATTGEVVDLPPLPKMLESMMRFDIQQNVEKYNTIVEKRREAGKKGLQNRWNKEKVIANANFAIANDSKPLQTIANIANTNSNTNSNTNTNTNTKIIKDIVKSFNDICTGLPAVRQLTDKRKKEIATRLKEHSAEDIVKVFKKAQASDFLKGDNARGWQANFDWLMKPSNFIKVLEGNYDNKGEVFNGEDLMMLDADLVPQFEVG